jgi:hypothetical protein
VAVQARLLEDRKHLIIIGGFFRRKGARYSESEKAKVQDQSVKGGRQLTEKYCTTERILSATCGQISGKKATKKMRRPG